MVSKLTAAVCLALACILFGLCFPTKAYAHGAHIEYNASTTVEITASYDTGEPMAGGQVTIYAPGDPSSPWLTGTCDSEGRFTFTPDVTKPGTWDVQVRQAGHGDMVHIPIGEGTPASGDSGFSVTQIVIMSLCVIWGLIGTALFVSRKKA